MVTQAKGKRAQAQGKLGKTEKQANHGRTKRSLKSSRLTDAKVRAARPDSTTVIMPDSICSGLRVEIGVSGKKSWRIRLRPKKRQGGSEQTITLGEFGRPEQGRLNCKAARDAAFIVKLDHAKGLNPARSIAATEEALKLARPDMGPKLCDLFELYIDEHVSRLRPTTQHNYRNYLTAWILPVLGDVTFKELCSTDVRRLMREVERNSKGKSPENRAIEVKRSLQRYVGWAINKGHLEDWNVTINVVRSMETRFKKNARTRVLLDVEIRELWASDLRNDSTNLFKLILLNATRLGETVLADWRHVDFFAKTWTLPAKNTKNGHAHVIPLSSLSMELLEQMRERDGGKGPIFPHWCEMYRRRMSNCSTFGDPCKVLLAFQGDPDDSYVVHDLRRTVARRLKMTRLNGVKVPKCVRQAILNHRTADMHDKHYSGGEGGADPADFFFEHREALEHWADILRDILNPTPAESGGGRGRGGLRLVA